VSKSEIESSKKTVISLKENVIHLEDSISNIDAKTDTIITYLFKDRVVSAKNIAAVKDLNVYTADSIWDAKYKSKKESLIADAKCDSLFLEHRSLGNLYYQSADKIGLLSAISLAKDTIIEELEFQNDAYLVNLEVSDKKLKQQKLKKWAFLITGLAGGFMYATIR
jgi:environmental stress-induced protein Ves